MTTSDILNMTIGRATNEALEAAVAVWFKDEDEIGGVTTGPIWLQVGGSTPNDDSNPMPNDGTLQPFHLDGQLEWFPVTDAEALAAELSVPLVRS